MLANVSNNYPGIRWMRVNHSLLAIYCWTHPIEPKNDPLTYFGHFRRFLAFFRKFRPFTCVRCERARLNNFFECESIIPFWQFIVEHVPLNVKWSPSFFWHQPFGLCARSLKGLSSNRPSQGRYQKQYLDVP